MINLSASSNTFIPCVPVRRNIASSSASLKESGPLFNSFSLGIDSAGILSIGI
ncbi:hypothetical protein VCRA2127O299_60115 [Vibrio crassostreae]|nr:hypothetical protein VCRA2113O222_70113 [Vibrio crassostreae]CAK3608764.1 hypothetical protein VCRA2122O275_60114 [Vibrio crassostreae]CAK3676382.1 hypothetical protein VCRA2127O299_60115 [Vibrio crassostreae]